MVLKPKVAKFWRDTTFTLRVSLWLLNQGGIFSGAVNYSIKIFCLNPNSLTFRHKLSVVRAQPFMLLNFSVCRSQHQECPEVEKELKRLLRADVQAESVSILLLSCLLFRLPFI